MKKKLLIGLGIVVVLLAGGAMYLAANANSLIAKYKPDLERIASQASGSHVTLGNLEASVFPSAKVRVDELRVARTATSKEALSLKNLMLHLRLLPLLTGNLSIVKLSLDSPQLTFIKDASGVSVEGLPKAQPGQTGAEPQGSPPADKTAPSSGPIPAGLGLNLDSFSLRNAKITLKDVTAGKEYHVSNLDVDAKLELGNNVVHIPSLSVTGRALDKLDFSVSGKPIEYSLADGEFQVKGISVSALDGQLDIQASGNVTKASGKAHIAANGFDLAKLTPAYDIVPALKDFALQGKVASAIDADWAKGGNYNARGGVTLAAVGATAAGVVMSNLNGKINLTANQSAQAADSSDMRFNLGSEAATLVFTAKVADNSAQLSSLTMDAFGGKVTASGRLGLKDQRFGAEYSVAQVGIDRAVAVLKPELGALLAGTVEKVTGDIAGTMGPDMKQSLTGMTSLLVKDGSLKGINIASQVLSAVKDLPFLSGSLLASAPPEKRSALESPDTQVGSMNGDFRIANAALTTQNFQLMSSLFSLSAQGSMGFDARLDMRAQIGFDPTMSQALVLKHSQLKNIQDQNGRLVIPLSISGVPPVILLLPDLEQLTKLAAQAALKQGAERLLDNVLKKGGGETGKKKGLGGLLGF